MRVLRILTRANIGGPTRQALALWDQDPAVGTQTLLAVGRCAAGEPEIDLGDRPVLVADQIDEGCRGLVRVRRLGRAARPWRDLRAVRALRALIRRFRPDIVHTHTSQAGLFGRRAAFLEDVPVIAHTFHGHVLSDYYPAPVNFVLRRLEAQLARRTHLPLAVSPSCQRELHQMGIADGRIQVLPPALHLAPFQAADRLDARHRLGVAGNFVVGFVGRLVPVKRPEIFVDLLASMPSMLGVVLGDGPRRERLKAAPNIRFLGSVERPEEYLAGLDALVLCSRREGCPLVALEAFAAGVPVIGFDVPGIRDVLQEWGTGILVPPEHGLEGLRSALREVQAGGAAVTERIEQARAGLGRFEPAQVAAQLVEHYVSARHRRVALQAEV
ncbi:MAG: glycosyltransferase [Planctomycetota bacterium]|nr:glycosyltransferase [Planctomycetota bacterium]